MRDSKLTRKRESVSPRQLGGSKKGKKQWSVVLVLFGINLAIGLQTPREAAPTILHRRLMKLLDELQSRFEIKNDRHLAAKLDISTPVVSRVRNGKCAVSAEIMIRIHEVFGLPIAEIKELCQ